MRNTTNPITRDQAKELGFQELKHYTVMANLIFNLGRDRHLSFGCIGTPNEMLFLAETDHEKPLNVTNSIVLSNYDYDGYLTIEKLKSLIDWFGK